MHMGLHHHRNTETFRLRGTLASHLVHPPAQSRVNSELRLGLPGLFFNWVLKTSGDWCPTTSLGNQSQSSRLSYTCSDILLIIYSVRSLFQFMIIYWLILPLCTSERRLTLSSWLPHRLTSLYFLGSNFFPFLKIGATLPFCPLSKTSPNLHYCSKIAESVLTMPSALSTPLNIHHLVPWTCVGWESQEIPDSGIWALLLMHVPLFLSSVSRHKGLGDK